jgi:hemerythrin-like domain-containing protein
MAQTGERAEDACMTSATNTQPQDGGSTRIAALMGELRMDHRNASVLLGLLTEQVKTARVGGDPDFDLVNDIMHYMTFYADAVHHPREDLVYRQLKAAGKGDGLVFVESDHRELAQDGRQLRDECEAVSSGAALVREKFVADAIRYIERLEEHMRWEENDLFRRADTIGDQTVELGELAASDPVFGRDADPRYASLLGRVRDEAGD